MIFRTVVPIALLSLSTLSESRSQKIDSLKNELMSRKGIERCDVFFELTKEYVDKDNAKALIYADSAYTVAKETGDSLRIAKTHRTKGQILRRLGRTDSAIVEFEKAIDISKRNHFANQYSLALNSLALAYMFQANYDRALRLYFECLVLREKEGKTEDMAITLNNIGLVYYKLHNWEKALEYYEKSFKISKDVNYEKLDMILINIGLCYAFSGQCLEALKRINEGINNCGDHCDENLMISADFGLGFTYLQESKLDSAEIYFIKSYNLSVKNGDKRFEIENLINLATIKERLGKVYTAIDFLKQAEPLTVETGYNQLRLNIYDSFSSLYTRIRDWREAVVYLNKYVHLRDTLQGEDLLKNVSKIQTEIEERENQAKILLQQQILILKEDAIERQEFVSILVSLIAVLLIGLAIVLFKINRQKQQINLLLELKVRERTEALEQSLNALIRVEDERISLVHKASCDLKATVATIEGLCLVASLELFNDELYSKYLNEFRATAGNLNTVINRLQLFSKGEN